MNGMDILVNPERAKYQQLWNMPEYRETSPGEKSAMTFLQQAGPPKDAECIDFGCGTGRAALQLALIGRLKVTMLDFTDNCLDPEVAQACQTQGDRICFLQHDLTKMPPVNAVYGYCTDVMEHIPEADVDRVLRNILASANKVFFQIDCADDIMGELIGAKLHLTVHSHSWWLDKFNSLGVMVFWSEDRGGFAQFYVSAWKKPEEIIPDAKLNVGDDQANANVLANITAHWQQIRPYARQKTEIMILAGGPSLNRFEDEIRWNRTAGMPMVCVNGSYRWALDRALMPSALIMVDAREENINFVQSTIPTCQYLMASQVSPKVLARLPYERTRLWHTGLRKETAAKVVSAFGEFFPVPGGSTVVLRAIPLLRMLGFWKMNLFGFDSCVMPDGHHAYVQKQNDADQLIPVSCGGRTFECAPWMLSQAQEFMQLVGFLGDEVSLAVHGDGLIAHIIETGASLSKEHDNGGHRIFVL